jgi:hypothetical protein
MKMRYVPQADVRVVDKAASFDSEGMFTLSQRMAGLADAINQYREEAFTPGNVWDQWVDPSASAGPATTGTGTSLLDHDLGFPCHSVAVDNPASQWIWIEPCNRWVPPYTMGWVYAVTAAGSQNARVSVRQPPGLKAYTLVATERLYVAFHEASLRPQSGMQLPSVIITGLPA